MSLTKNLMNMQVAYGPNFEDRFNLQGSGSITRNVVVFSGNGAYRAVAFTQGVTNAQLLALNNLPVGSVVFDTSGFVYVHNSPTTWNFVSGSVVTVS
jgi:hypothetical protein